jgi:co-chaperonin GroES (HSP10)
MQESRYLKAFETLSKEGAGLYELVGDLMLVEVIKDEEFRTKSGLVITSSIGTQVNDLRADKPSFARVLEVGRGTPNDDGVIEQYDVSPGDIVLVPLTSIRKFSVFGSLLTYGETQIGLCKADDIQLRFKGQNAFNQYFRILNQAVESQVPTTG